MTVRILTGDCRDVLKTLPDESVHCVVTSPPYWGLRDYGTAQWEGGDPGCGHSQAKIKGRADYGFGEASQVQTSNISAGYSKYRNECACGARRIDSQLGLEPSFQAYIETMVGVFREVLRVLRRDGTCWVNMGDSYSGYHGNSKCADNEAPSNKPGYIENMRATTVGVGGLKPKDLCGIPWRLAFALQADGWWLRSDIIWSKPNPMPESVTDRPTKAHEYLFLLVKSATYYYDCDAIRERTGNEMSYEQWRENAAKLGNPDTNENGVLTSHAGKNKSDGGMSHPNGRNRRTVWEIATQPFSEAHFAVYPTALVEPCIKAGTSEKGCCAKCGAPWVRQTKSTTRFEGGSGAAGRSAEDVNANGKWAGKQYGTNIKLGPVVSTETIGWSPSCSCNADVQPCTVLDCFGGAGTTGLVADRLGRNAILIELSPQYAEMAERRLKGDGGLFASVEYDGQDDFGKSLQVGYQAIRERIANGGPGWTPKEPELL